MNRTKKISLGDKIFARVTRNGQTIYNFVSEKVADMSQLINLLRFAIKDVQGLVMIHIRNYNQGWGEERPLMLYASQVKNYSLGYSEKQSLETMAESGEMTFPWENH